MTTNKSCKGCLTLEAKCEYTAYNKKQLIVCPCSDCILKMTCVIPCPSYTSWQKKALSFMAEEYNKKVPQGLQ